MLLLTLLSLANDLDILSFRGNAFEEIQRDLLHMISLSREHYRYIQIKSFWANSSSFEVGTLKSLILKVNRVEK